MIERLYGAPFQRKIYIAPCHSDYSKGDFNKMAAATLRYWKHRSPCSEESLMEVYERDKRILDILIS